VIVHLSTWLGHMPSPVDKYVKQVKEQNPDYTEAQVWATAWSIYCKHKNPGSEHCKKPAGEYLKGKSAMDDTTVRVAAKFSVAPTVADRVASRYLKAMSAGETFESETWRIHRFRDSIRVTPLENAGKRGKKVVVMSVHTRGYGDDLPIESIALELLMHAKRNASSERMQKAIDEYIQVFAGKVEMYTTTQRGVDVMPAGFKNIAIQGDNVYVEAEYDSFRVKNQNDPNETTCIPAISGGKKSIPVFYRWVKDNESKIKGMKYYDVLRAMKDLGIDYHSYCAMD